MNSHSPQHADEASCFISISVDAGEGYGTWRVAQDEALLALVTDASIACGGHAGDPDIMRRTCQLAVQSGTAIGAHVGFRDLIGFGRRFIQMSEEQLTNDILCQLGSLDVLARAEGSRVSYIKPHGALYQAANVHPAYARAVTSAAKIFKATMPVMAQPGSLLAEHAVLANLALIPEGFADRAYDRSGHLVDRAHPGALILDPEKCASQAVQLAKSSNADSNGSGRTIRSVCVHSDSPGALANLTAVRRALLCSGVALRPATEPLTA